MGEISKASPGRRGWVKSLLLIAALIGLYQSNVRAEILSRPMVVGGRDGEVPDYFVVLGSNKSPFCGGSLIAPGVVATAAHCVASRDSFQLGFGVRTQDSNSPLVAGETWVDPFAVSVNPGFGYSGRSVDNDIALIFFDGSKINLAPIALNEDAAIPAAQSILRVMGWGNATSFGVLFLQDFQVGDVDYIDPAVCRKESIYGDAITDKQVCAGSLKEGGVDSCQGDSGGPMVQLVGDQWVLVGIVSFGAGCAQPTAPGIYTRLSSYKDWIKSEIEKFQNVRPLEVTSDTLREDLSKYCFFNTYEYKREEGSAYVDVGFIPSVPEAFTLATATDLPQGKPFCSFTTVGGLSFDAYLSGESFNPGSLTVVQKGEASKIWVGQFESQNPLARFICPDTGTGFALKEAVPGYYYGYINHDAFEDATLGLSPLGVFDLGLKKGDLITSCKVGDHEFSVYKVAGQAFGDAPPLALIDVRIPQIGVSATLRADAMEDSEEDAITGILKKEDAETYKMTIANTTGTEIFSWMLKCNYEFSTDGVGWNKTAKFFHPQDANGYLGVGKTTQFSVRLRDDDVSRLKCKINGAEVKFEVGKKPAPVATAIRDFFH